MKSLGQPRFVVPTVWVVIACFTACSETPDPVDRETSNEEARAVLDSVQLRAGGPDGLAAVRTLAVQYVHTRFSPPGAIGANASPPRSIDVIQVRDFANGRQFYERRAATANGAWERVVIVPGGAFRVNLRTQETTVFTPDAGSSALYSGLEFRWYVYAALNEALFAASSLQLVSDTTLDGSTYHILTFDGAGTEQNRLWVNADTKQIVRRRLEASDPVSGTATTTVIYSDYTEVGGLPMPMTVEVLLNDEPFERFELQDVRVNVELQDSAFEPPQE